MTQHGVQLNVNSGNQLHRTEPVVWACVLSGVTSTVTVATSQGGQRRPPGLARSLA